MARTEVKGLRGPPATDADLRETQDNQVSPKLSLCMIVRDNEDIIGECLESVKPWVDEMIVVDTGSTDRTPSICEELGAKVERFEWVDDFSAARNQSIQFATGDWIFWMDSDDLLPAEQGRRLRELVEQEHPADRLGYVMQVHCLTAQGTTGTVVDHVKLFRRHPGIRFERRIHEQIIGTIREAGGEVDFTDIFVEHRATGTDESEHRAKLDRDLRILNLELAEEGEHPFLLFNLGMTHENAGDFQEAADFLIRSIEAAEVTESHVAKAFALLVSCFESLGQPERALEVASEGLCYFPGDAELLFRRGISLQHLSRPVEAIADYQKLLADESKPSFRSIDPAIKGSKACHNMAICFELLGRYKDAVASYEKALRLQPSAISSWEEYARLLASGGDFGSVHRLFEEFETTKTISGFDRANALEAIAKSAREPASSEG